MTSRAQQSKLSVNESARHARRLALARWAKYVLLACAVFASITPVYWLATISLKTEVDQFAVPPRWFSFHPTLAHYSDAFLTRSFGQYLQTSAIVAVLSTLVRAGARHVCGLWSFAVSIACKFRQANLDLDTFNANVSAHCERRSALSLDARRAVAQHYNIACDRLHCIQSSVRRVDDAGIFPGTAARAGRGGDG